MHTRYKKYKIDGVAGFCASVYIRKMSAILQVATPAINSITFCDSYYVFCKANNSNFSCTPGCKSIGQLYNPMSRMS